LYAIGAFYPAGSVAREKLGDGRTRTSIRIE